MSYNIAVIKGDGIGPEIVTEAMKVLDKVAEKFNHTFNYTQVLMGGCSIDATGVPLTDEAIDTCKTSDAVLMGSIGGDTTTSHWYKLEPSLRPEAGLLKLRKSLGLFANIRPAYLYKELKAACPLKDEIIGDGFDMVIMRELTGGLYFGERKNAEDGSWASDEEKYSVEEVKDCGNQTNLLVREGNILLNQRQDNVERLTIGLIEEKGDSNQNKNLPLIASRLL